MKITLAEWAARNYDPTPSIRTLRIWAATGQIVPPPEKVGRTLMVDERAVRVPLSAPPTEVANEGKMSDRALAILHAA
jgi:predicted site-specific integrase-resolvase